MNLVPAQLLRNASMAEYDTARFELEKLKEQEEQMTADGAEPDYEKLAETRCEIARLEEKDKVFGTRCAAFFRDRRRPGACD